MHLVSSRWRKPKPRPSKKILATRKVSAIREERRLKEMEKISQEETVIPIKDCDFLLLHISCLKELFKNVRCNECDCKAIEVLLSNEEGFSTLIKLKCQECESMLNESYSSPKASETKMENSFVINSEITDALNSISLGRNTALKSIHIVLNINCISFESFYDHLQNLWTKALDLEDKVLTDARNAIREAYSIINQDNSNDSILDIAGSYDCIWLTKDHSFYGIGIIIDALTGLVVDFEICSKYCSQCSIAENKFVNDSKAFKVWYTEHTKNGDCNINLMDSSNSMEVEAAKKIWSRSILKNKMQYTTMMNDRNSEFWTVLNEIAPYKNVIIGKEEAINFFYKRLGIALRKLPKSKELKEKKPGQKSEDLTESTILVLQSYYRQAITKNAPDVEKIQIAIQASLDHYSSTDLNPKHDNCPKGKDSSCFYNGARAQHIEPKSHKTMKIKVNETDLIHLQPLYDHLASEELLKRCTKIQTQNAYEILHSLILKRCPKEIYVSRRKMYLAVINAVTEFNTSVIENYKMKINVRNENMLTNKVQNLSRISDTLKRNKESKTKKRKQRKSIKKRKYSENTSSSSDSEA